MGAMTAERLDQYLYRKKEIKMLEAQYQDLLDRKDRMTSDSVSGSMAEYPYIKHVVKIEGLDIVDRDRAARMRALAWERKREAEAEVEEIDRWIASIKDSRIRLIVHLKVVRGMSWVQVAHAVGGGNKEDGVRKAYTRFLQKS